VIPSQRVKRASLLKQVLKKWYRVKHAEIGGVSTSQWLLGLGYPEGTAVGTLPGKEWISKLSTFGLARRFQDVLKCTEGGVPVPIPLKPLPSLVHLATVGTTLFVVPSFKSYSGWVERTLNWGELGNIFDFSELTLNAMEKAGERRAVFSDQSPPLKVCHAIKVLILAVMSNTQTPLAKPVPTSVLADIPKPLLKMTKESALLQVMLPHQEVHDAASVYLKEYGDKAAKGEDARVPTELWDGHLFKNYFPSLKYEYVIHGRAMVVLREKFLLRMLVIIIL
jgi:hypothetical protein